VIAIALPVRSRALPLAACACAVAAAALDCPDARADVTSWLALGGGATAQIPAGGTTPDTAGAFTWALGVGSTPRAPIVVGMMYRGATFPGLGTDLGLPSLRLATGGFARGDWGVALDGGTLYRTWGNGGFGRWPIQEILTVGSPWGFQLAIAGQEWDISGGRQAEGIYVALEIDLLRLTVGRQGSSERWWPNPNPAGGHEQSAGLFSFSGF
jgi:hypothetical protein